MRGCDELAPFHCHCLLCFRPNDSTPGYGRRSSFETCQACPRATNRQRPSRHRAEHHERGEPRRTFSTLTRCRQEIRGSDKVDQRKKVFLPNLLDSACPIQGLLRLHSRYGPPDRSAAQRRPLSRGSNPCGYPHEPLVSYQINRQLYSTDDSRLRSALPPADI